VQDYGNYLVIDHGDGYTSWYAHLKKDSLQVTTGQKVLRGQYIAKVGSTGNSTGNHVHFEIRKDNKAIKPEFSQGGNVDELEKLRKEADDARKARDENWRLYQSADAELKVTQKELGEIRRALEEEKAISDSQTELNIGLVRQLDEVRATAKNKEEADRATIEALEKKLTGTEFGALQHITLALKSALAGKW
jgi:hypothetical protein